MKELTGYKVITDARHSAIVTISTGGVEYPKLKKTKPKKLCGPLCIFDTLDQAMDFVQKRCIITAFRESDFQIVTCKYKKSKTAAIWNTDSWSSEFGLSSLPRGTVLADSVTCLE